MLVRNRTDQCVIISGESGAGKTEASKIFMQYVAAVSGGRDRAEQIKDELLASNPILEAFGNAKTLRNDNSSRFGKYMEIIFNYSGVPDGGKVSNYLLEKSRVVMRAEGERSYHIFYMLLTDSAYCQKFKLSQDPSHYKYLAVSNCYRVDKMDDSMEFKDVKRAMKTLGMNEQQMEQLFKVVAAVLHLGQLEFSPAQGGAHSSVANQAELQKVAECLGTSPQELAKALTHRSIAAGAAESKIDVYLNPKQASDARDALAKSIYERLFSFIIQHLNQRLQPKVTEQTLVIGVLDIYGFEIFGKNGFNQFIINLTNEKLQQVFIERTLKQEQEEYMREGIQWTPVEYFNNKVICDMIEQRPIGVIAILDESTLLSNTTDAQFLEKLTTNFKTHKYYEDFQKTRNKEIGVGDFRVKHYAGDVTYAVDGFIESNRDTLFPDLINCMAVAKNPLLPRMFQRYDSKKRPQTLGTQFRAALSILIDKLMACEAHYIRCIKPNESKRACASDDERFTHQIRYLGLVENVRVRRAGFAFRMQFNHFFRRYKLLSPQTFPRFNGSDADGVRILMQMVQATSDDFQMGKTKIFLRHPQTLFRFEELRNQALPKLVVKMQTAWRGFRERAKWQQRKAAFVLQLVWRTYKARAWTQAVVGAFNGVEQRTGDWGAQTAWPQPPTVLQEAMEASRRVHQTWRAHLLFDSLSEGERDQLRKKAVALVQFAQRKPWDYQRYYRCDYLQDATNPRQQAYLNVMSKLFNRGGDNQVLFSDVVGKVNPKGKVQLRAITVTDLNVYHQDPKNYAVKKVGMPIASITGIYMSPLSDRYVVVACEPPVRDLVLDLGVSGEERASELVAVVCLAYHRLKGQWPRVSVAERIEFNNQRDAKRPPTLTATREVRFQYDAAAKATKFKVGAPVCMVLVKK